MSKILIIDDDRNICKFLVKIFTRMNHDVQWSLTLKQGLEKVFAEQFDVVFLDVNLPDGNGLKAIELIFEYPYVPEIIIMTGDSNPDGAELAMKSRAWDYIQKNGKHQDFKLALTQALEYRQQKQLKNYKATIKRGSIIGESRLLSKCLDKVYTAASNDLPVLITGETGTGKELFSKAIHNNSKRQDKEFVVVDCAALPEYLVESTLFGHTKGAFTGADSDKTGLMTMADKGTLFLDEVGELSLSIQKKFLRVLQEKQFRPVGSKKEIKSDFRLICATLCDLPDMVKNNQFREDLFFRMFSLNIHLPPLKDRKADIKALVQYRLTQKQKTSTISKEFLEEVEMYEWPGNVRELINTIDLICSDTRNGNTLYPHHLPRKIRAINIRNRFNMSKDGEISERTSFSHRKDSGHRPTFKEHIEKTKHEYLLDLLSAANGNIKKACRVSGLSRSQLYRLMQQYNLKSS
ncbi:MAG: sigma-54-dependent Fis family transcriptional regulator [Desulfobacula sp.]|nr:sigma-54-dependent Fis family transcriptional regulator [Desulfobacula sp.]